MMVVTGGISVLTQCRLPEKVESIRGFRCEILGFFLAVSCFIAFTFSLKLCSSFGSSVVTSNRVGPVFCRFGGLSTGSFSLSCDWPLAGRRMCFRRSRSLIFQEPYSEKK